MPTAQKDVTTCLATYYYSDAILNSSNDETYIGSNPLTFTIPSGVNVVEVDAGGFTGCHHIPVQIYYSVSVKNKSNNNYWIYSINRSGDYDKDDVAYIAVTPGKTYTLIFNGSGVIDDPFTEGMGVYYSASINNHTPDVYDL